MFPVSYKNFSLSIAFIIYSGLATNAIAETGFGPLPISLKDIPTPNVPGLLDGTNPIVVNKEQAIILGKALFWDTNVGSDGMACGSCHFHAGADTRTKNQLSPGGKSTPIEHQTFERTLSNAAGGPNYSLTRNDFPFFQRANPLDPASPISFISDDVSSSSGTFSGEYINSEITGSGTDNCSRSADLVFHVDSTGTRRVEPRNAPTVINSIFNHRNFWDGRANNIFNGSSPWGNRDLKAGIWVKTSSRKVEKQRLNLINSSLASLALAPPLSDTEMGCKNRTFSDLGRKLLMRKPLDSQKVHYQDSILGSLSLSSAGNLKPGLNTTYTALIRKAFNKKYWSYRRRGAFGRPASGLAYNQMEANFSMFFALSLQLYQATLVSDDSPFDRSARNADGIPTDLSASEINGLARFRKAHCSVCHVGPLFTPASIATNAEVVKTHPEAFGNSQIGMRTSTNVVTRMIASAGSTLIDTGFSSNGVTSLDADIGLGGKDPFGHPLSFSKQYLQHLVGNHSNVLDPSVEHVSPCNFQKAFAINFEFSHPKIFTQLDGIIPQTQSTDGCIEPFWAFQPSPEAAAAELANPDTQKMLSIVDGAFKIPSLRNIELTGPYMHNGGMASLKEVIEFYTRGGNIDIPGKIFGLLFSQPDLRLESQARDDIIAFLKTLTDERVKLEKAPFDHPEIKIPHGHIGDNTSVSNNNPLSAGLAQDEFMIIEAVGANGKGINNPLLPFDQLLSE